MRKRNIQIITRLSKEEHQHLSKLVKKSGVSQEVYVRHLINGVVPQDTPPPDYYAMMRELHGIGNNLNQIAQKAHILGVLDVQRYDEAVRRFEKSVKAITGAVILPRPIE
ncbi:MAG: plasmid mobilization relaxosome protein MobC [Oscillospiraceae bacterium]